MSAAALHDAPLWKYLHIWYHAHIAMQGNSVQKTKNTLAGVLATLFWVQNTKCIALTAVVYRTHAVTRKYLSILLISLEVNYKNNIRASCRSSYDSRPPSAACTGASFSVPCSANAAAIARYSSRTVSDTSASTSRRSSCPCI